jgi:hypothetical protein
VTFIAWILTLLFAVRVLGQATQHWVPQSFLPAFDAFQGSALPYWMLLASQAAILAVMISVSWRMTRRRLARRRKLGIVLGIAGGAYMLFSLGRIAVGLAVPEAHAWFFAWIPAFFHIVLAGFVLTVCVYHLRAGARVEEET